MTNESTLILDPSEVQAFVSPEQAVNYIREKIEAVREQMAVMPPPPTDDLTSVEHLHWHNRLLILYGRAIGTLMAAQAFGHITVQTFQDLKKEAMGTMLRRETAWLMDRR